MQKNLEANCSVYPWILINICLFNPYQKKVYANTKNAKKKYVTYNLKFIDSARHINASLSNLVDNLSEINKCNCDNESLIK